jgi:lactoylglutathione lyase
MPAPAIYLDAYPIGSAPPTALPVPDVDCALPFYLDRLGFTLKSRSDGPPRSATVVRDQVELGLVENGGDPEQESAYIEVSDVDAAREELAGRGLDVTTLRTDHHGGNTYRVFFVKDDVGLCYCLGTKQTA